MKTKDFAEKYPGRRMNYITTINGKDIKIYARIVGYFVGGVLIEYLTHSPIDKEYLRGLYANKKHKYFFPINEITNDIYHIPTEYINNIIILPIYTQRNIKAFRKLK